MGAKREEERDEDGGEEAEEEEGGALGLECVECGCGWSVDCRSLLVIVIGRRGGEPQATCGPRKERNNAQTKRVGEARMSCSACLERDWSWYTARRRPNTGRGLNEGEQQSQQQSKAGIASCAQQPYSTAHRLVYKERPGRAARAQECGAWRYGAVCCGELAAACDDACWSLVRRCCFGGLIGLILCLVYVCLSS